MRERVKELERMEYAEEGQIVDYIIEENLGKYFDPLDIQDITDFDNEANFMHTFYVSLHGGHVLLLSDEFDAHLEKDDAYFIDISVSSEKPVIFFMYLKYPKGGGGTILEASYEPFLREHYAARDKVLKFAEDYGFLVIDRGDIEEAVVLDEKEVSVYYKYFVRDMDNPLVVPF